MGEPRLDRADGVEPRLDRADGVEPRLDRADGVEPRLDDVVVVDLSTGLPGAYCTKLFADAGAVVVDVEPPDGDPLRRWRVGSDPVPDGEDGALFRHVRQGQHSLVAVDLDDLALAGWMSRADVIVTSPHSGSPASFVRDPAALADAHPGAIVVSVTPYGLTGPYAGRPASDLTIAAEGGAVAGRGLPSQVPIQAAGRVLEWVGGAYAAVASLAALREQRRSGLGELIDVSMCEVANLSCTLFADLFDSLRGRPDLSKEHVARTLETPSIEPTSDGYVGFNTNTRNQYEAFVLLIERPDLLEDPAWSGLGTRMSRWDEWNEMVHAFTTRHTTDEIVRRAAELRIPVAPVTNGKTVLEVDHIEARGVFVDDADHTFRAPRRAWLVDGQAPPAPRPAPALGSSPPSGTLAPRPAPTSPGAPRALPLAGLKVLDLTTWWAGPSATGLLALLGADVVHVESTSHVDGVRMTGGMFAPRPDWWELSAFFLQVNLNKRDLTIDLATPAGNDLALQLIAGSDLIVENFTPRVLEGFDLAQDAVRRTNPAAVFVRMPAFGLAGPWRDRPGFAQTMEQMSGLAWLTGHVDDQPRIQRGPCDPNGGLHAAFAALVALHDRERTGEGAFIEAPMFEAALNVAAEQTVEYTAYGNLMERDGNRSPWAAPQGIYAAAEPEQWLAVAVEDDEQWRAVCKVVGRDDWAGDPALASHAGRRDHHDLLDAGLAEWAASQPLADAVEALLAVGVPAGSATDPRRGRDHPQLSATGYFEQVVHPVAGTHATPTAPFHFRSVDSWVTSYAPTLGQHNNEILAELGLGPDDLARLEAEGVIGTRPAGV